MNGTPQWVTSLDCRTLAVLQPPSTTTHPLQCYIFSKPTWLGRSWRAQTGRQQHDVETAVQLDSTRDVMSALGKTQLCHPQTAARAAGLAAHLPGLAHSFLLKHDTCAAVAAAGCIYAEPAKSQTSSYALMLLRWLSVGHSARGFVFRSQLPAAVLGAAADCRSRCRIMSRTILAPAETGI